MQPRFRERLTPPSLWYAVAVVIGGSFGFVLLPLAGAPGFVLAALAGAAVAVGLLVGTSAEVVVEESRLRAGRAAIDRTHLGLVTVLDREQMSLVRGTGLDARAYLCQRGWLATGVRVEITDPADPAPYWVISSRRPQDLAAALHRTP